YFDKPLSESFGTGVSVDVCFWRRFRNTPLQTPSPQHKGGTWGNETEDCGELTSFYGRAHTNHILNICKIGSYSKTLVLLSDIIAITLPYNPVQQRLSPAHHAHSCSPLCILMRDCTP